MKSIFLLLLIWMISFGAAKAQFTANAYGTALYNASNYFGAFKDKYNMVNESTMANKLGSPNLNLGYTVELGYRIMGLSSSLSRTMVSSRTHATFQNDAKRIIRYQYKITNINIGAFKDFGKSEMTIEIGMTHLFSNLYSYVELPNGEVDNFTGGASHTSGWVNIGGNAKINYLRNLSNKLLMNLQLQGIYVNNKKDVAPRLVYQGTEATHTLIGAGISAGLTYKIGEKL
ncbi:MAG: hypothetical protein EOP53_22960 [Sphingobacteriales bacterium]|nr:MAG: hypothetical protein EOP53_22960 [Sphingobacteriales bacterium]